MAAATSTPRGHGQPSAAASPCRDPPTVNLTGVTAAAPIVTDFDRPAEADATTSETYVPDCAVRGTRTVTATRASRPAASRTVFEPREAHDATKCGAALLRKPLHTQGIGGRPVAGVRNDEVRAQPIGTAGEDLPLCRQRRPSDADADPGDRR